MEYYKPTKDAKIHEKFGLVRIPVWLPDDEIMVDRLGMSGAEVGKYWLRMAEKSVKMNVPLIVQLHPERIDLCGRGLEMLLEVSLTHKLNTILSLTHFLWLLSSHSILSFDPDFPSPRLVGNV